MIFKDLAPNQVFLFNIEQQTGDKRPITSVYLTMCETDGCLNYTEDNKLHASFRYFIKIYNNESNYYLSKCYYCNKTYETDSTLFVSIVKTIEI